MEELRRKELEQMHSWLRERRAAVFSQNGCSYCEVHKQFCPANVLSAHRCALEGIVNDSGDWEWELL
eukprot:6463257-Amphidinium_carterae.1